jgi:uncharacterized protein Yka (UPF0111/DUF47 family)
MMHRPWFLPESPHVLEQLCDQATVSVDCLDALVAWAEGAPDAADHLRAAEQQAGDCKLELWRSLRAAFATPIDPEDLYALSFRLDLVLSAAHNLVRASEVLGLEAADGPSAEMATVIRDGVASLRDAFGLITKDQTHATQLADQARHTSRDVEQAYRDAMRGVLDQDDLRQIWAESERYNRFVELADRVVQVSDRVWYAVIKED